MSKVEKGDPWAHMTAIRFYTNRIENAAISAYMMEKPRKGMSQPTYDDILKILDDAYDQLTKYFYSAEQRKARKLRELNPTSCRPPFCPDDHGRCVPCLE